MWFKVDNSYIDLFIYAKPNAKKSALIAVSEEALHVAIQAKPQDGAANKELIEFIAKLLKIPKSHCELIKGKGSRHKQIRVPISNRLIELFHSNQLTVTK